MQTAEIIARLEIFRDLTNYFRLGGEKIRSRRDNLRADVRKAGNLHGTDEPMGLAFTLKYRCSWFGAGFAAIDHRALADVRRSFSSSYRVVRFRFVPLLEMLDPRVSRSTGSRNRKANRNDHLFRIRLSFFIVHRPSSLPSPVQTASRASSLRRPVVPRSRLV